MIKLMKKFFQVLGILAAVSLLSVACKESKVEKPDAPDAPVVSVEIDELSRTAVTFTVTADSPGDYAWKIVPAEDVVNDAESLFEVGETGMFDESNSVTVTYNELEGGKEWTLYVAARKINPYVYSALGEENFSTMFDYEDMITLEKVTTNTVTYHIEMPEGASAYRHMLVDYNDFLFISNVVGATYDSYLSAFGLFASESDTYVNEWVQLDGWGNFPTNIYSDTKYIILAGKSDGASLEDGVSPEDLEFIEFRTPKAEECPYGVEVTVSDITSLTASVSYTPEEGVDRYRAFVMSESDYESFLFEGEEAVRKAVIGDWEDFSTEYKKPAVENLKGLMPDTKYYVCVVVFDEDMRELYIEETFRTAEPSGPVPVISVAPVQSDEPWKSAKVCLKMENAVSGVMMLRTRYAVDEVLDAPGNEDVTMEMIIRNNGDPIASAVMSAASSEDGAVLEFSGLSSNTKYIFGVMATNVEHVSEYYVYEFTTAAEPVVETTLFDKLKGEYTAAITDLDGKAHTFDVTIADGVNDATREAYAAENLLVCLGFDPCGIKYHSPQDLLDKKWAKDEETANRNYGPKWFLEIDQDENITTYQHAKARSSYDAVNDAVLIDYSAEGEDPMASFDGRTIWFKGTYWKVYAVETRPDEAVATTLIHDVDYDESTGVITIEPVTHYKSWSSKGQMITEYPGVEEGPSWTGGSNKVIFCGNSALVLTPKSKAAARASVRPGTEVHAPEVRVLDLGEHRPVMRRR